MTGIPRSWSRAHLAFALLLGGVATASAQSSDAVDSLHGHARSGDSIDARHRPLSGDALLMRSPTSVADAMRWEPGVTSAHMYRIIYRGGVLRDDQFLVDGMYFGERFTPETEDFGERFLPTPSLLSIDR